MLLNLRLLAHACVLAGLLSVSAIATAQPKAEHKVGLEWARSAGAEGCIGSDELVQKVEERLGREVFSRSNDSLLLIEGTVGRAQQHGFDAVIRVRGPDGALYGSREVSVPDPDCRKLDEVLALIISVTLRHAGGGIALPENIADQLEGLFEDAPAEPAAPEPAAAPAPVADGGNEVAEAPLPSPSAEPRVWQTQLEAGVAMATGLAPSISLAPLLRLQLELWERFSFGIEGRLGLGQKQRIESEPRGSLEYHKAALALTGCVSPLRAARLRLAVCVDGRVGNLSVRAQDFAHTYNVSARWLELTLAGSLRLSLLGPTFAQLRVGVPWRIIRPRFKYESNQGDLHDAFWVAPWGLDLSLSLGANF